MTVSQFVQEALHRVMDPCSIAVGNPMSILDLGLIRHWCVDDDGVLRMTMCLTTPGCTLAPVITANATEQLRCVPGVDAVEIVIDPEIVWEPAFMSEKARQRQDERRNALLESRTIRPYAERAREQLAR